jgi:hypothetical protein
MGRTVNIGEVVRNAAIYNFRRAQPVDEQTLLREVTRLFNLLDERQIDYVLVGGIALLQYVEGRNTEDIDLILALSDLKKVPEIEVTDQNEYFAQGRLGPLKIDFLLTRNPFFRHVQRTYVTWQSFEGEEIPCASVEGLLLLKLYALPSLYRQGNFARVGLYENDVATLLQYYPVDLDPLMGELANHLNESDYQSVEEIVGEVQQRLRRFRKGQVDNESPDP